MPLLLLVALATLLPDVSQAAEAKSQRPANRASIPLDPKVRHGVLDNGFTYYIRDNDDSKVEFTLVVKAGPRYEDRDQVGLAHLIEHVIMNGGTTRSPGGLNGFYIREGLVGYHPYRATTGTNETVYHWAVPGNKPELLNQSLRMLRDFAHDERVLANLQDPAAVANERSTVLDEFRDNELARPELEKTYRMLGSPKDRPMYDPMFRLDRHNQNIREFKLDSAIRFYREWYRPSQQAAIIVGDVDEVRIGEQVAALFGDLRNPPASRSSSIGEYLNSHAVKLTGENQFIRQADPNAREITLEIVTKRPATRISDTVATVGQFRDRLAESLYNRLAVPRFVSPHRRYASPIQNASHELVAMTPRDTQIASVRTIARMSDPGSFADAVRLVIAELERIRRHGFAPAELSKAKEALLEETRRTAGKSSTLTASYQEHFVYGAAAPGPEYRVQLTQTLLDEIDAKDIASNARRWLDADRNTDVVIVATQAELDALPGEKQLERLTAEARKVDVKSYRDAMPAALMAADELRQLSKTVDYRQEEIPKLGATRLTLANGVTVVFKRVKAPGSVPSKIELRAFSPGGASRYGGKDYLDALKSADIVTNSGVAGLDKFQLATYLEGREVLLSPFVTDRSANLSGAAPLANLQTLMELVYQYFVAPNRNQVAFDDWRLSERTMLETRARIPTAKFHDAVDEAMSGESKRLSLAALDRISFERAYRIYRELYSDAGEFTFVIAGDVELEEIKPALLKYLGNLPAVDRETTATAVTQPADKGVRPTPGLQRTIYSGEAGQNLPVCIYFSGEYPFSEANRVRLQALGKTMFHALFRRLVEKEGTYGVVVGAQLEEGADASYRFKISFQSDAVGVERKIAAVFEEIASLRDTGPSDAVFQGAIEQLKQDVARDLGDPAFWAQYLVERYQDGRDPSAILRQVALLDRVTADDVQAAAREYLTEDRASRFVMMPQEMRPDGAARIASDVAWLAADVRQGRRSGTEGFEVAADYLIRRLREADVQPGLPDNEWLQRFTVRQLMRPDPDSSSFRIVSQGRSKQVDAEEYLMPKIGPEGFDVTAPAVFVGYGIVAPEKGIDDYAGIDVRGKIVVAFGDAPTALRQESRYIWNVEKMRTAAERGAVGFIELLDRQVIYKGNWSDLLGTARKFDPFNPTYSWLPVAGTPAAAKQAAREPYAMFGANAVYPLPHTYLSDRAAQLLFEGADKSFARVLVDMQASDGTLRPFPDAYSFALPHDVSLNGRSRAHDLETANVIGFLPGADPSLENEVVVVTAHLDHVGRGPPSRERLGKADDPDDIYNGAVDNALGVAIMLEVALLAQQNGPFKRGVLFVGFGAEEQGLVGSDYYVNHPSVPLGQIAANLNVDMPVLLHLFTDVIASGAEQSSLGEIVKKVAARMGLGVSGYTPADERWFNNSDHLKFAQKGVPALDLHPGFANGKEGAFRAFIENRYHQPDDDSAQPIDYTAASRFAQFEFLLAREIANARERATVTTADPAPVVVERPAP